jgi:hypothetical protein
VFGFTQLAQVEGKVIGGQGIGLQRRCLPMKAAGIGTGVR